MGELGWFEDRRVELIEGEVIERPPIGSRHLAAVILVGEALRAGLGGGYVLSVQSSLGLGGRSEPEPDVAVLPGEAHDYKDELPATAALVVEVSDTTLTTDRTKKAATYAKFGLADYWIVDLDQRQLEVRRRPALRRDVGFRGDDSVQARAQRCPSERPQRAGRRRRPAALAEHKTMAIAERELAPPSVDGPTPYRWTREQFHRMGDAGLFRGQPVILIEGEVFAMPPIGPEHQSFNTAAADRLRAAFGGAYLVRERGPLNVGDATDPQPDIAVVEGRTWDFLHTHPTRAALVVEISVTTLVYDRGEKASLYAMAGVDDYWIVNVNEAKVEVYRRPVPDPGQPFGYRYAEGTIYERGQTIQPLAAAGVTVSVADLLPPEA